MTERRTSSAQLQADSRYKQQHTHSALIRFWPKHEREWQHLQAQPNKMEYMRRLIREDIDRNGAE